MGNLKVATAALLTKSQITGREPPETNGCGLAPLPAVGEELADATVYCDAGRHYERDPLWRTAGLVIADCPAARAARVRDGVTPERKRLALPLARLQRLGGAGFSSFDPSRQAQPKDRAAAEDALAAMVEFSEGRPPTRNVLLAGETGLAKTHLFLAAHFTLLRAGVESVYVTSPELRDLFRRMAGYDDEALVCALRTRDRIIRAAAVLVDDIGDIEGDQRFRGQFAEGFKALLDGSAAAWAFSTNCSYEEAERHPDIGTKILSRMLEGGARIVHLTGEDQRLARSPTTT